MSEQESLDIGKVVSLIMENPQIIEQISGLMKQRDGSPATEEAKSEAIEPSITENVSATPTVPTYSVAGHPRGNRAQLLGALKPYVSEERAKAIDSMISIADILDMMRAR